MNYYFKTTLTDTSFEEAIDKTIIELKKEGFGVLTEIDLKATLKKKLNVDFRPYKILGACNPLLAHTALLAEDKIGIMLPCNVILQEKQPGVVEVAVVDPIAAMGAVQNDELGPVALKVRDKMENVIRNI